MKNIHRRSFLKSGALSLSGLMLPGTVLTFCKEGSLIKDFKKRFKDKTLGCFMGAAIGDSMGGPVECQHYLRIRKYAGNFNDLLPFGKPISFFDPPGNGWAQRRDPGTITDDTYIRIDLLNFFLHVNPPYSAEKLVEYLLENSDFSGWWEPPKNQLNRIKNGEFPAKNARQFMDILSAVVAGQSAAFKNDASIDSVVKTVLDNSGDKTRKLFERAINIGLDSQSADKLYDNLYAHASVANSTHTGEYNRPEGPLPPVEDIKYSENECSSIAFAEQQPWALAYLVFGNGDPEKTLLTAVKGGRDADSIATNTASWLGALYGLSVWPEKWISAVLRSNLVDFDLMKLGDKLAEKALRQGFVQL
ncbi:MAG: ADP-ribosylglycohydrolase family protein [Bacteroidales bacterium]